MKTSNHHHRYGAGLFELGRMLHAAGYYVGPRDPQRNIAHAGAYMVAESLDVGETENASTGGFCIVGDDIAELIREAAAFADDSDDPAGDYLAYMDKRAQDEPHNAAFIGRIAGNVRKLETMS